MSQLDLNTDTHHGDWQPTSWRHRPASQQPAWPDQTALTGILNELRGLPALVFSEESRTLMKKIALAQNGGAFILQMGNCAERFKDCSGKRIHNFLRIMLQMAYTIESLTGIEVVMIGRVAGQYAKPRSSAIEERNGQSLPSFRGDNVNGFDFTPDSRTPDPRRMLEGYFRSVATLNLIRAFWDGDYSQTQNLLDWQQHFFRTDLELYDDYEDVLRGMENLGKQSLPQSFSKTRRFFCSHEALLLEYEEAFTRLDTIKGGHFNTAAHSLWIGDRTRSIDGAHVEYIRGIGNPIGIKVGPGTTPKELKTLLNRVNPKNLPGRITLITRLGAKSIACVLPDLIESVTSAGICVAWMCDPMHGNTQAHGAYKTRDFNEILHELMQFVAICERSGVFASGMHLEITDEFVTECFGGFGGRKKNEIPDNYLTAVDPRLNAAQGFELAMRLGKALSKSPEKARF